MSYSGSPNDSGAWRSDGAAHAYDPYQHPELFRGVATRRAFAFLIDMVVISVPVILGYIFIALFGVVTLGIGWALFWLCLLYTSPSPRDLSTSRMPSSA